ncbi:outer membrane beta-barrel protein [Tardiphaga sp. 813_E8_N1_3]|uniref:outer membrane beta-barrel protein n=1 Tax=Tardiphaga sp. 813_E8_N1_3 TaxID=3240760 RepID=UPI003F22855C
MLRTKVFIAVSGMYLLGAPAHAEDEFLGSLRLRGGYDTNPQFTSGGAPIGSAFIATDVALAAAGKDDKDKTSWGIAAEASATRYAAPELVPALTGKVILRGSMGDDAFRLSSTTTIADVNTYNLRTTDLLQAIKVESLQNSIRLFATAEGGRSTINQTNAIFADFLPVPLQYWRGAIIPGVSVIRDKTEIGVSVNLSARRYTEEFDVFGYRRDNERIQPFLFAKYDSDTITAAASVSQLFGYFHDVDFSNINRTMYDATLTWRLKPLTLDFTVSRRAAETSFPISPITIDTIYSAKATWQVDPKLALTAGAAYATMEYLDSPFRSQTYSVAVGMSREIMKDLKWGMDVSRTWGTLIDGEKSQAIIVASSLTKTFSPELGKPRTDDAAKPLTSKF